MAIETAGQIINDALVELGLSAVSDPYADTDPNVAQMCALLKSTGRMLIDDPWTVLRTEYSFVTVQGTSTYALPADFDAMLDQTGWNRTNQLPLGGPISAQMWQYLKARQTGVVFTVLFRPLGDTIYIYPDNPTPGGYTIAFEYQSENWIEVPGIPTNTFRSYPTESTDIVRLDSNLVSRALKVSWLRAKGFDSSAAYEDYRRVYANARGADSFVPILSLNGPRVLEPLLGQQNIPITGYGF
jgi:hypothetical protein